MKIRFFLFICISLLLPASAMAVRGNPACLQTVRRSIWGKVPQRLLNKMDPLVQELTNAYHPDNLFAGYPGLLMMGLSGRPMKELRAIGLQSLEKFFYALRDQFADRMELLHALEFIRNGPDIPDNLDPEVFYQPKYATRWLRHEFTMRTLTLELSMYKTSGAATELGEKLLTALELAHKLQSPPHQDLVMALLILSGDFSKIVQGASLIKDDKLLVNIARMILNQFYTRPEEFSVPDLHSALIALSKVQGEHRTAAQLLLIDFAYDVSAPGFAKQLREKALQKLLGRNQYLSTRTPLIYDQSVLQNDFLILAFKALYFSGQQNGRRVNLLGFPETKFVATDGRALKLMGNLLDRAHIDLANLEDYEWVVLAIEARRETKLAADYARYFVGRAEADKTVEGHLAYLLAARLQYIEKHDRQAGEVLARHRNHYGGDYQNLPAFITQEMGLMAEFGDAEGLVDLVNWIDERAQAGLDQYFSENRLEEWAFVAEKARFLQSQKLTPVRFLRYFHPSYFVPLGSANLIELENLVRLNVERYHCQTLGPKEQYRRIVRAEQYLGLGDYDRAAEYFLSANYAYGVEKVGDRLAARKDPESVARALLFYAMSAQIEH